MHFFRHIKKQTGFSLTEVMVGGAILAGVALAGAKMFSAQTTAQKKITEEQRLSMWHQGLVKTLAIPANCNATFKQQGLANASIPNNQNFSGIYRCSSNCSDNSTSSANVRHKAQDVGVDTGSPIAQLGTGNGTATDNYIDKTKVWGIRSMRIDQGRSTSGPLHLKVQYFMNPALVEGRVREVTKEIIINARFDSGQFKECLSAQESSTNNLQNDLCKTFNYKDITSSGDYMARWNEAEQICDLNYNKNCSNQGLFVDGVDSLGQLKCRNLINTHDASILQDTSAGTATCSAGQKPTVVFVPPTPPSNLRGRIRIECR